MLSNRSLLLSLCLLILTAPAFAGEADVIAVKVHKSDNNAYDFSVTVSHDDTGWEHYANRWVVVGERETIFATRVLHHPHVDEQPFTRSLAAVGIPDEVKTVTVRAHDSVHQYGGKVVTVTLP